MACENGKQCVNDYQWGNGVCDCEDGSDEMTWYIEPQHDKTNKAKCACSEDSDPPRLIRVFALRFMDSQGPKLSSGEQRRL